MELLQVYLRSIRLLAHYLLEQSMLVLRSCYYLEILIQTTRQTSQFLKKIHAKKIHETKNLRDRLSHYRQHTVKPTKRTQRTFSFSFISR
jgi:hypothetical protein